MRALIVVGAGPPAAAQFAPSPVLDVVSVKINLSGEQDSSTRPRPGGGVHIAAVQERVGPRPEAARGPVQLLVIDRAEMPTED